jgi:Mg2+/Co2+ transporter CorB
VTGVETLAVASGVLGLALLAAMALTSSGIAALSEAPRNRVAALAERGDRRALHARAVLDRQAESVLALRLARRLLLILTASLASVSGAVAFGPAGAAVGVLAALALQAIVAEALPRTAARAHPERVLLAIAPALALGLPALLPVVVRIEALLARLQAGLGRGGAAARRVRLERAEEVLRGAIEGHAAPDGSEREERAMLRSVLDLADVTVGKIMVHRNRVVALDLDQPPATLLEQALSSAHTRIPVYRGSRENIVGILHAKALLQALRRAGGRAENLAMAQIAARPWFIPDTTTLLDQLHAFRRRREHFAVVVDEYGVLMGIVTLEDILEEIVGDIAERHDFQVPGVRPQPDGAWLVDGTVTIRDLNREFGWRLPDGPAATIAGLVMHESRAIPDVGQVFVFHGLRFEVLRRKRNQVALLRVLRAAATR